MGTITPANSTPGKRPKQCFANQTSVTPGQFLDIPSAILFGPVATRSSTAR
jgi:hypothetical protein